MQRFFEGRGLPHIPGRRGEVDRSFEGRGLTRNHRNAYLMKLWMFDRHIRAINWLIVAILAYFLWILANDVIFLRSSRSLTPLTSPISAAPLASQRRVRSYYDAIIKRDVFNLSSAPEPPVEVATDLPITLIGTSQLTDTPSFIIVEDNNDHKQSLYRLGSDIPHAGKLVAVEKDRAVIQHLGKRTTMEMPKKFDNSSSGAYEMPLGNSPSSPGSPWHIPQFHNHD